MTYHKNDQGGDKDQLDMTQGSEMIGASHDQEIYQLVFAEANTGILLLNLHGHIVVANQQVCVMLRYSREELIGRHIEDLVAPDDSDRGLQNIRLVLGRRTDQILTVQCLVCKDGSYLWTGLKGKTITTSSGVSYTLIVLHEDMTFKQDSDSIQRLDGVLAAAIGDSAAALTSTLNIDEVLDQILSQVARVVPYDTASFMQVDGAGTAYIVRHRGWVERGAPKNVLNVHFLVKETDSLWKMFNTGRPFSIPDTQLYDGWRTDIPEIQWIRSYIGVPVRTADSFIGFLNLDSARPGFFTSEQAERLQAFADQAAAAITNARLYAEVTRNAAELEQRVAERTAELHRAKERAEVILSSSSDGVIILNLDGVLLEANQSFSHMLGYENEELIGETVFNIVDSNYLETMRKSLGKVASSAKSIRIEVALQCRDRTVLMADLAIAPLTLKHPGKAQLICSFRDISERIEIEEGLRNALAKERELSELKARFASMVSHEFRTPLTTIGLKSWLLRVKENQYSEEQRTRAFDQIDEQLRLLTGFMDDILDIGRTDALGLKPEPISLDLDALCHDMLQEIRQSSGGSMADRFVYAANGACSEVFLDPNLIRRIVMNLLSNAVKYSHDNTKIYLQVSCTDLETTFMIRDQGIGIPSSELPNLFTAFFRAKNVGQVSGTGLGLAIVDRAVKAHGGTVSVDSELGHGSTFVVTIPVQTSFAMDA